VRAIFDAALVPERPRDRSGVDRTVPLDLRSPSRLSVLTAPIRSAVVVTKSAAYAYCGSQRVDT
jgi:hypothetical protein